MSKVKKWYCQDGCGKNAVFNFFGNTFGVACKDHADKDMIDIDIRFFIGNCLELKSVGGRMEPKFNQTLSHIRSIHKKIP